MDSNNLTQFYNILSFLTVFLPMFFGFLCTFINKEALKWLNVGSMFILVIFALMLFNQKGFGLWWVVLDGIEFGIINNSLTQYMRLLITLVTLVVMLYSTYYISKNAQYFTGILGIFAGFMLLFMGSYNLVTLFIGWEGVGLVSYLLISYYFNKNSAARAATKAFIVNRIGDCFLLLAIVLFYQEYSSFNLYNLGDSNINFYIALGVLIGAMSKSAQLGLHVWLAEAMEGPTPVSALLHAATMVTAGLFLILRLDILFINQASINNFLIYLGMATSIMAGLYAIYQDDLKKTIAYSTCSQLGLIMLAIGFSNYNAAFLHLFAHGFFKALLFLGAGIIIHHCHSQKFSELLKYPSNLMAEMPMVFIGMLGASLALMGVMPSGFVSKEAIMHIIPHSSPIYYLGFLSSILTACYSFKLLLPFFVTLKLPLLNKCNFNLMQLSLIFLFIPSLLASNILLFHNPNFSISRLANSPYIINLSTGIAIKTGIKVLLGLILALSFYKKPYYIADPINTLYEKYLLQAFKYMATKLFNSEQNLYNFYNILTTFIYNRGKALILCEKSALNLYVTQIVLILASLIFLGML